MGAMRGRLAVSIHRWSLSEMGEPGVLLTQMAPQKKAPLFKSNTFKLGRQAWPSTREWQPGAVGTQGVHAPTPGRGPCQVRE